MSLSYFLFISHKSKLPRYHINAKSTMEKLAILFPFVKRVFATDGISSSEARRIKETNGNDVRKKLVTLSTSKESLYNKRKTILTATGEKTVDFPATNTITPKTFECVPSMADLNGQSAFFGFATAQISDMQKQIGLVADDTLATTFGIQKPVEKFISLKQATRTNIETFCGLARIEELLLHATAELLNALPKEVCPRQALYEESAASVYGNQLTLSDCFIRTLMEAKETLPGRESELTGVGWQIEQSTLSIKKDDFVEKQIELEEAYKKHQQAQNGFAKLIKDKARELQIKFQQEYNDAIMRYNEELQEYRNQIAKLRLELVQEVSELKVALK